MADDKWKVKTSRCEIGVVGLDVVYLLSEGFDGQAKYRIYFVG